ncbi:MAG: UDP-2,3-diacylglucosamine diphosphatase LpxI [Alphaproteobacteria bacterium]|nr:UDP-2,3-diacylglucosamine diphosphatase LpxI [Alphaproteobacteria bacterium]
MSGPAPVSSDGDSALAIVCGGGSLPFALADAATRRGRRVVLLALRGWADPQRVDAYPHHWAWAGQLSRMMRFAIADGCRDVAFIGSVTRPSLWQIRPDFRVLRMMPQLFQLYRGGDDHLQAGIGRIIEQYGFRLVGPTEIAPELAVPRGLLAGHAPNERDRADIALGLALLRATSPFDIGQAVVVAENQVLAVEGPEGTDRAIARVAELRRNGRVRSPAGTGVLIKSPKAGQDHRIDLPAIGPPTVEAASAAGLAGIAVVAGSTIVAEPERIAAVADRAKLFVVGVDPDETQR